jgi:type IV pilus assembly protein PilA
MKLKSGFSLIELLVVVAIIGILAAIGTVGYNKYVASADTAKITANNKQIADGLLVEDTKLDKCESLLTNGSVEPKACARAIATASNIKDDDWSIADSDNGSGNLWSNCDGGNQLVRIGESTVTVGHKLVCQY